MGNGTGIASMIIGIIVNILHFVIILPLIFGPPSIDATLTVFFVGIIILVIAFVGLIIGIVGLSSDDRKVFAIIGVLLCAHPFIFVLLLIFSVWASTGP